MGIEQQHTTTGHSRHLRAVLADRRKARGWSGQRVADLIARDLGLGGMSAQTVYYWESFERHPAIDRFAAWARVLGMRLMVDLDDQGEARAAVLLRHQESREVARLVDLVDDPAKRAAITATVKALLK